MQCRSAAGETIERICTLQANQWHNVQLTLDLQEQTVSGSVGTPGHVTAFSGKPFSPGWPGRIDLVVLDSAGHRRARASERSRFRRLNSTISASRNRRSRGFDCVPITRMPHRIEARCSRCRRAAQGAARERAVCDDLRHGGRDAARCSDADARRAGPAWRAGPRGFIKALGGGPLARRKGQRPARAGAVADPKRQPADRAGDGQSDLAVPLRARARQDAERFRGPRPAALASGVAGSPGDEVHPERMVDQGDAPSHRAERDLSAVVRRRDPGNWCRGRRHCG